MSRHAQESRTVKIAKSPKMTMLLETVPVIALTGISFGGSCGNIFNFFGACGIASVFQFGDTACPDLLCLVAAREILRDRRIGRVKKFGWITWPMVVLIIGIAMTLTLNFLGDDKAFLKWISGSEWAPVAGLLPGAFLLLVLAIFHRRETGTAEASGTKSERRTASAGTSTPDPKITASVPAPALEPVPAKAAAGEGQPQPWTDEDLVAEARSQWAEHAAMGVRLSQARFEMALRQSPRGGAGRPRVIKALTVVRAEMDGADDEAEAVAR